MSYEDYQKQLEQAAKATHVHNDITHKSNMQMDHIKASLNDVSQMNVLQSDTLDILINNANALLQGEELDITDSVKLETIEIPQFKEIKTIPETNWNNYIREIDIYIETNKLRVGENPFQTLMTEQEKAIFYKRISEDYKLEKVDCDKYDYMMASFSGIVTGLIDVFFVGAPGDSKLNEWTDKQVDNGVQKFAKVVWNHDKTNGANLRKEPDSIASAIGFLERRFKINYDARFKPDLVGADNLNMSAKNHHLKSLGHSPDIVGLFFSILDQFTGKSSFISDGKILRYVPIEQKNTFELQGSTLISKVFAGIANWFGHLISDVAGSSGVRGHTDGRRGSGIPIPFFNLFQTFNFGNISSGKESITLAEFSVKVFESGYDARFGATMAIPVAINELIIRFFWSMKQHFYHGRTMSESMPIGNKADLRRMLLVGHGALCLVDGADALIRSNAQPLLFATRLNIVAWNRFGLAAFLEIRRMYCEDTYDLVAMNKDIDNEWHRLYSEAK